MLLEEAEWVGDKIKKYFLPGEKVLNLGSSTKELREIRQPHMLEFIFNPAKEFGIQVFHVDMSQDVGVDIVGDLTDDNFINSLKENDYKGVLCCNLLEHLNNRRPIIEAISDLLNQGNRLIITVPFNYPYHLDPIDTYYRPSISELVNDLKGFKLIEACELKAKRQIIENGKTLIHKNYFEQLKDNPTLFITLLFRCCLPFYKTKMWWITVKDLCNMFSEFKVTCAVLEKK